MPFGMLVPHFGVPSLLISDLSIHKLPSKLIQKFNNLYCKHSRPRTISSGTYDLDETTLICLAEIKLVTLQ